MQKSVSGLFALSRVYCMLKDLLELPLKLLLVAAVMAFGKSSMNPASIGAKSLSAARFTSAPERKACIQNAFAITVRPIRSSGAHSGQTCARNLAGKSANRSS